MATRRPAPLRRPATPAKAPAKASTPKAPAKAPARPAKSPSKPLRTAGKASTPKASTAAKASTLISGTRELPLSQIVRWVDNPRKDLGDLSELAASLKGSGQIHDLAVRPHPTRPGLFEVAAGNRRHAAAELAGLTSLRCTVHDLSDAQMLEIAITENGQRSSLTPLEESSALYDLRYEHNIAESEIAARIGRPVAYVHQRISLQKLISPAEEALRKGRLLLSVALKLARLPHDTQTSVLPELLVPEGASPRPLNQCDWAFNKVHLTLASAPFSKFHTFPEIAVGACDHCPKRSAHQVNLFENNEKDLCLDPGCFKKKSEAAKVRALNEAKAKGIPVLDKKQSEELIGWHGDVFHGKPWIDLNAEVPEPEDDENEGQDEDEGQDDSDDQDEGSLDEARPEPPRPTWREVLGDKVPYTLAEDREGKLHYLVSHEDAREALSPTAPAELHQAVAPKEPKASIAHASGEEDGDEDEVGPWVRDTKERQAALRAIAQSRPMLDPEVFRAVATSHLMLDTYSLEESLKEAGLWQDAAEDDERDDEEHALELLSRLSLDQLWGLWVSEAFQNPDSDQIDRFEAALAPRPADEKPRMRVLMARAVVRLLAKQGKQAGGRITSTLRLPHKEASLVLSGLLTTGKIKRIKGKGFGWDSHWELAEGALEQLEAEEAEEANAPKASAQDRTAPLFSDVEPAPVPSAPSEAAE